MEYEAIATADATELGARFSIDVGQLRNAVDFLNSRIVQRRNTVPILSNIAVDVRPCGTVALTGNNLDMAATFTVGAFDVTPGAFTVSAAALADALRKADKGATVSLAYDVDAGRVTVAHGRARLKLTTLPVDDFPVMHQPQGGNLFTLAADYVRGLARVAPFASTEETKYYLRGVAIEACQLGGAARLAMVATDGWVMSATSAPLPDGAQGLASSIIASDTLKAVLWCADRVDGATAWHIGGGLASVDLGNVVLTFKLVDGAFPDWQAFIQGAQSGTTDEPLLIAELEPRLDAGHVARVEKVTKAPLAWECGSTVAVATDATAPDWLAIVCLSPAGYAPARKGYTCGIDENEKARAVDYLEGLAKRYELCSFADRALQIAGMDVRGMTCGAIVEHATPERRTTDYVERLCYETFTTKLERIETVTPAVPAQYVDGAYSVIMPRDADAICLADATFAYEANGKFTAPRPLYRNAACAIELSTDAVRAIAGPVDEATHVHIPARTMWRGKCVAIDGVPTADMPEGFTLTDNNCFTAKDWKLVREDGRRSHPYYDAAEMLRYAKTFDAIRPLTAHELANPVAPFAEPTPDLSPVEPCHAECAVKQGDAAESCEAVPTTQPNMPAAPVAETPVAADALAAIVARVAALEAALASRVASDPAPVAPVTVARAPRAVRERLVRAYLRMRAERDMLRHECAGWKASSKEHFNDALALGSKYERALLRARSFDIRLQTAHRELRGTRAESAALMEKLEQLTLHADALQDRCDTLEGWNAKHKPAFAGEIVA